MVLDFCLDPIPNTEPFRSVLLVTRISLDFIARIPKEPGASDSEGTSRNTSSDV